LESGVREASARVSNNDPIGSRGFPSQPSLLQCIGLRLTNELVQEPKNKSKMRKKTIKPLFNNHNNKKIKSYFLQNLVRFAICIATHVAAFS
jgi:hypothetical protein